MPRAVLWPHDRASPRVLWPAGLWQRSSGTRRCEYAPGPRPVARWRPRLWPWLRQRARPADQGSCSSVLPFLWALATGDVLTTGRTGGPEIELDPVLGRLRRLRKGQCALGGFAFGGCVGYHSDSPSPLIASNDQ